MTPPKNARVFSIISTPKIPFMTRFSIVSKAKSACFTLLNFRRPLRRRRKRGQKKAQEVPYFLRSPESGSTGPFWLRNPATRGGCKNPRFSIFGMLKWVRQKSKKNLDLQNPKFGIWPKTEKWHFCLSGYYPHLKHTSIPSQLR